MIWIKKIVAESKIFILIGLFIISLISFSLYNVTNSIYESYYSFALFQAKENFKNDILFCGKWSALEEGFYVPRSKVTILSPDLDLPNRNVETKDGIKLTLIIPKYLMETIHNKVGEAKSHFVSLKPTNSNNKPDSWEAQALKAMEKGIIKEKLELQKLNGEDYFRYIAPIILEKSCLKCHSKEGYKIGNIRGGISVSIPFDKLNEPFKSLTRRIIIIHLSVAFLSFIFLFIGAKTYRDMNKKTYDNFKRLEESEATVSAIIEGTQDSIWAFDRNYKILYLNHVFQNNFHELFGINIEKGSDLLAPISDSLQPIWEQRYDRVLGKEQFSIQDSIETIKGIFHIEVFFNPIIKNGEVIGGSCFARNITDRKLAEKKLKESEEKYRLLIETSQDIIYTLTPEGVFTFVSRAWTDLLGHKVADVVGKPFQQFVHPIDLYPNIEFLQEVISMGKRLKSFEYRVKHLDGSWHWHQSSGVPYKDSNGNIIGFFGIARDITTNKKAKEEIKKLLTAIEQSEISIIITDKFGNIQYVNPNCTKTTGYTKEELLNQNLRIPKSGYNPPSEFKKVWTRLTAGKTWEGRLLNRKKNGEPYWEYVIITPIKNDQNEITHCIAVKEDITEDIEKEKKLKEYSEHLEELVQERTEELDILNNELIKQLKKERKLEEELKIALNKEKELNELRTNFIASVSHEFRTPLAALSSSVQMILRYHKKWSEEKLQEHFTKIENITDQLTKLIDQILTISRAEREILKFNPENVKLKEFLGDIIFKLNPQLKNQQAIAFKNSCKREEFLLDPNLLDHVVVNLLRNAIKFSPEHSTIQVIAQESDEMLNIKVIDKGIGIPKEEIRFIFEPFYRTSNSQNIHGTGLGLNIVKRCVEIMQGEIKVESEINIGTTFTVTLPIREKSDEKNIAN